MLVKDGLNSRIPPDGTQDYWLAMDVARLIQMSLDKEQPILKLAIGQWHWFCNPIQKTNKLEHLFHVIFEIVLQKVLICLHILLQKALHHLYCTMHYVRMKRRSEKRLDGEIMSYFT